MRVRLYACDPNCLRETVWTDSNGRAEVASEGLTPGTYELVFGVSDYFGVTAAEVPFLGEVPVRFGIAAEDGRYHVPLLVSPYGYTTYRGS